MYDLMCDLVYRYHNSSRSKSRMSSINRDPKSRFIGFIETIEINKAPMDIRHWPPQIVQRLNWTFGDNGSNVFFQPWGCQNPTILKHWIGHASFDRKQCIYVFSQIIHIIIGYVTRSHFQISQDLQFFRLKPSENTVPPHPAAPRGTSFSHVLTTFVHRCHQIPRGTPGHKILRTFRTFAETKQKKQMKNRQTEKVMVQKMRGKVVLVVSMRGLCQQVLEHHVFCSARRLLTTGNDWSASLSISQHLSALLQMFLVNSKQLHPIHTEQVLAKTSTCCVLLWWKKSPEIHTWPLCCKSS